MFKGARKAIVRAPHRLAGSKSIEDRIILEWAKDFSTAETAIDLLISEVTNFSTAWKDIFKAQGQLAQHFNALYLPIIEDNQYAMVQETPESSIIAIKGYLAAIQEVEAKVMPIVTGFEAPFVSKCKTAKECIHSVHKALKKRERKKMDFDRHSHGVEKLLRKQNPTEKDRQNLAQMEQELNQATEIFHAQDEKVKSTVPFILTTMSEFLNPLTAQLYLTQLSVYKVWTEVLFAFSQAQGLAGTLLSVSALGRPFPQEESSSQQGEPYSYLAISETWAKQFMTIQVRCEQGLETLRKGKAITQSMHSGPPPSPSDPEHKKDDKPRSSPAFRFISPQGLFWTEADLLQIYSQPVSRGSTPSTPGTPLTASHRNWSGAPSSSSSVSGAAVSSSEYVYNGRTPVTTTSTSCVAAGADSTAAGADHLRIRVRASLSTAARTLAYPKVLDGHTCEDEDGDHDDDDVEENIAPAAHVTLKPAADFAEPILRRRSHSKAGSSTRTRSSTLASSIIARSPPAVYEKEHDPSMFAASNSDRTHLTVTGSPTASPDLFRSTAANGTSCERAVALFTFHGEEPGDVAFRQGDLLKVLDHGTATDDQWWLGQTSDGRLGLFPRNYVQLQLQAQH